jgi:hypothetical protein
MYVLTLIFFCLIYTSPLLDFVITILRVKNQLDYFLVIAICKFFKQQGISQTGSVLISDANPTRIFCACMCLFTDMETEDAQIETYWASVWYA